jgi:hypothetical protein
MKNLSFLSLLSLALLLGCTQEDPDFSLQKQNSLQLNNQAHIVQKATLFPFLPAGDLGGPANVLNPGTMYPPTKKGFATLKRGSNFIQFNLHTTGLPEGAYTVWYVIFNEPDDCNEPNPAGGVCAGANPPTDLMLSTTAIIWATGKVVKANGVGNFQDRIYVGERREPGTQEAFIGGDLNAPLENPQDAEVHLIVKYHGLASDDPDVLYEQTHTLLGSCGEDEGANSFYAGPIFGVQCFDPQAAVFPVP